ncbi:MAG TPA: cation:proton antiporter [archaeon]|nr:cation:proton antiporter [archaeon]
MASVIELFFFVAAIIFAGFFGNLFFKRTRFSDFVLLMFLGLLIGPVFNLLGPDAGLFLKGITPFFASLALMILLFEGGLQLNLYRVLRELPKTTIFTLLVFVLSVAVITAILLFFGWNLFFAILVGCILGGTSAEIIIPLVNSTSVSSETKTFLTLESAITDALCVIAVITMGQVILAQTVNVQVVLQSLFSAFSISAVLGGIFGVFWIGMLRDFSETKKYDYVLTVALLFLLYAITEYANGNGAFSALVFGMVLGNAKEIAQMLRMKPSELDSTLTAFHTEISFFVRTFFFVYLGLIFDITQLTVELGIMSFLIALGIYAARRFGSRAIVLWNSGFASDQKAITALMARGLAAAVLATYPVTIGIIDANLEMVVQVAFMVILFTNIMTTVGLFDFEKSKAAGLQA